MRSRLFLNSAWPGLLIFAAGLAARVLWVLTLKNELYWSDEHAFWEIARGLASGKGYVADSYRNNPVLPVYLSVVFRIFGESLLAARLGQCLAGALTCLFVYGLAGRLFGQLTGFLSGLLLAVYPPHIYLAGVFYAECLLILWGSVAAYLAVRSLQGNAKIWWAATTGMALGLAALTRTTLVAWLPSVCLAWLCRTGETWRTRLALCAALALGSAAVIVPWSARNYRTYGAFIPVSSGFGTILWQANNPFSTGLDHSDWELYPDSALWKERLARLPAEQQMTLQAQYRQVLAQIDELTSRYHDRWLALDRVLMPVAVRYIASHPLRTLQRSCRRLRLLFSAFSPTVSTNEHTSAGHKLVAALAFYPVLALALLGMVLLLKRWREVLLIYLLIFSVIAMTSVMTATQTRYRLPLDPYLIVFASVAATRWLQKWLPQWFDIAQGSG